VRLHQERWTAEGSPGVFAADRFTVFHREIVAEWLPRGRAVLARLSVGDEPVAVLYGFVTGSRFDFYQSGVRRDGPGRLRSPGHLAHLLLMQLLAERGVTAYDFLRSSSSSYKRRLATRESRLIGLRLWRPTLRATTRRSVRFAARVARRGLRSLFSGQVT
jgi:CelD/BcsL family acetyltransferase involved in cellulose biosynthesis